MKKILIVLFVPLWFVSLLSAQSLAELAKKEKARRESLKGKKVVLVTNTDLTKTIRKPAVTVVQPFEPTTGAKPEEAAAPQAQAPRESPPPRPSPRENPALSARDYEAQKAQLEAQVKQAEEMVDLLQTKLGGLWQEFYSMDNQKTKDKIQQDISDFYAKLQGAEDVAVKARQELENFVSTARKEDAP
jgi:hypothetical protein